MNGNHSLDGPTISAGLFLPLLEWTGAVVVASLAGYPTIAWLTPLAWLLAIPVGLRVRRQSASPGRGPVREAALGGCLLGIWQGLLFGGVLARVPALLPRAADGWRVALVLGVILAGSLIAAGLAGLAAAQATQRAGRFGSR